MSIVVAMMAAPGLLGTQEAIRQAQSKEKREEHRARRCNFIAHCIKPSQRAREINDRPFILRDGRIFIDSGVQDGEDAGAVLACGYYLPYPDCTYEGMVTRISVDLPIMNWVYIDAATHQLRYGIRKDSDGNFTGPFDCTSHSRRVTFHGWEGWCAVEEQSGLWAVYFDVEDNALRGRVPAGTRVLEIEVERREERWKKADHGIVAKPQSENAQNQEEQPKVAAEPPVVKPKEEAAPVAPMSVNQRPLPPTPPTSPDSHILPTRPLPQARSKALPAPPSPPAPPAPPSRTSSLRHKQKFSFDSSRAPEQIMPTPKDNHKQVESHKARGSSTVLLRDFPQQRQPKPQSPLLPQRRHGMYMIGDESSQYLEEFRAFTDVLRPVSLYLDLSYGDSQRSRKSSSSSMTRRAMRRVSRASTDFFTALIPNRESPARRKASIRMKRATRVLRRKTM